MTYRIKELRAREALTQMELAYDIAQVFSLTIEEVFGYWVML